MTRVSICLLAYNRGHLLPSTLDSLLSQTYDDFELLISDDCSKDETSQVCLAYALRDNRIRFIRRERNLGMPGNLNATLQEARFELVANLHDGDVYHPQLIEKWVHALDASPTAGFVFNAYRSQDIDGREIIYRENYGPLIEGTVLGERLLSQWNSCVFGTVMARRSAYEAVGWFDQQFGNFSDVDMWLRLARRFDVAYVNEPLMDLMPRDPTRFYAFVHWRVIFWILGIHALNLRRYSTAPSTRFIELAKRFPQRKRNYILYNMLLCLKHKRFDRAKEGLATWLDADDIILASIGKLVGQERHRPDWYDPSYWTLASLAGQGS